MGERIDRGYKGGAHGPVEVLRAPVLSTCHLSKHEGTTDGDDWPAAVLSWQYGWLVYVGDLEADDIEASGEHSAADWPGLLAAAKWARSLGYSWVRFDCDAEEQPGLPKWSW